MIQMPSFDVDPNKMPWEYEPWELLYYQTLKEYKDYYKSLEDIDIFGCEVRLQKDGENTIRTDFLGCLNGENGLVVCELKVNRQPERQAYTELFAYANHIRSKFAPMGRRDIFYLLISPMEERIVREATINNLLYDKNRVVVLIPEVDDSIDSLRFRLWIPEKKEFEIYARSAFAFENIDTFKISWRGVPGKWSPIEKGKEPDEQMMHRLNKVSHYAAQLMEANGINGFVFCSQLYPVARDYEFLENGIIICGVNPFKSAKTRFLIEENGLSEREAAKAEFYSLEIDHIIPDLKKNVTNNENHDSYWYLLAETWSACIDSIGLDVVKKVNRTFGPSTYEHGYGTFDWDSYLNNSSEDDLSWKYDISLTGIFRELYDLKLERHYQAYKRYSDEERREIINSGEIEWHIIDMMYSHEHIRKFIKGLREDVD